jgi:hypothetical protein
VGSALIVEIANLPSNLLVSEDAATHKAVTARTPNPTSMRLIT